MNSIENGLKKMLKRHELKLADRGFIDETMIVPRAKLYLQAGLNLALIGHPGTAKSTLAQELAGGEQNLVMAIGGMLTCRDFTGKRVLINGTTVWQPGFAQLAAEDEGKVLFIDEGDKIAPESWTTLAPLLDGRRKLIIPDLAKSIEAGPNFRVIICYNPSSVGLDMIPRCTRDRFVFIEVPRLSEIVERELIMKRYGISLEEANYLIRYASIIRTATKQEDGASTRQLEFAASAVSVGVPVRQAAQDCMMNPICVSNPSLRSAISNAIVADGIEFHEVIRSIPKPNRRRAKVTNDEEFLF